MEVNWNVAWSVMANSVTIVGCMLILVSLGWVGTVQGGLMALLGAIVGLVGLWMVGMGSE